jgi:1-acyl-sn-glycerol-3-phosphate acyltransferase
MKAETRHAAAYRVGRVLLAPVLGLYLRLTAEKVPALPYPYVAVINHSTDLDFLLPFGPFGKPMYFVAGETLFRGRLLAAILRKYFDPIVKQKGHTDMDTVISMIKKIRSGHNICLFAEGNTTFDGRTGAFPAATGGFIRTSGAGLVTYRFEGGYRTLPRWSRHLRRGRIRGVMGHAYPPEQLANMTGAEINAAIARDIAVDDTDTAASPARYRSRRKAEGLENVLYLCPKCGQVGTIAGHGSVFACACGMKGRYTDYGGLADGSPFASVREWCLWQRERLAALAAAADGKPVLRDEGQTLCLQLPDHSRKVVASGTLKAGAEGLSLGDMRFPMDSVTGLALYRRNTLLFTVAGTHYQVLSDHERSGLKYRDLYEIVKGKKG